jgi:hypothetical protein
MSWECEKFVEHIVNGWSIVNFKFEKVMVKFFDNLFLGD